MRKRYIIDNHIIESDSCVYGKGGKPLPEAVEPTSKYFTYEGDVYWVPENNSKAVRLRDGAQIVKPLFCTKTGNAWLSDRGMVLDNGLRFRDSEFGAFWEPVDYPCESVMPVDVVNVHKHKFKDVPNNYFVLVGGNIYVLEKDRSQLTGYSDTQTINDEMEVSGYSCCIRRGDLFVRYKDREFYCWVADTYDRQGYWRRHAEVTLPAYRLSSMPKAFRYAGIGDEITIAGTTFRKQDGETYTRRYDDSPEFRTND